MTNRVCPAVLYGATSGWTDAVERIVAAREPQKLPVVLSADEIVRFLEAVPGPRNRAALTTAYGAGPRVGEVARLTTSAIERLPIARANRCSPIADGQRPTARPTPHFLPQRCGPPRGPRSQNSSCDYSRRLRKRQSGVARAARAPPQPGGAVLRLQPGRHADNFLGSFPRPPVCGRAHTRDAHHSCIFARTHR